MARTRYAKNGDIHIAFQVHGEGPFDIVLCGRSRASTKGST